MLSEKKNTTSGNSLAKTSVKTEIMPLPDCFVAQDDVDATALLDWAYGEQRVHKAPKVHAGGGMVTSQNVLNQTEELGVRVDTSSAAAKAAASMERMHHPFAGLIDACVQNCQSDVLRRFAISGLRPKRKESPDIQYRPVQLIWKKKHGRGYWTGMVEKTDARPALDFCPIMPTNTADAKATADFVFLVWAQALSDFVQIYNIERSYYAFMPLAKVPRGVRKSVSEAVKAQKKYRV